MTRPVPEPRIFLHSDYSLEQRALSKRSLTLLSNDYRVVAILAGRGRVTLGEQGTEMEAGHIVLLNPQQAAEWAAVGCTTEILLLSLAATYLYELAGELQIDTSGELLFRQTFLSGNPRSQALTEVLREELTTNAAGRTMIIDATIKQLAVYLLRHLMNGRRNPALELSRVGLVDRRLRRAIEFMHLHCAEELSLTEIAQAAYLSAYHFARLFKRITGLTPHAYLATIRLERARQLLATSDLSINDIAARVGYESQSHFAKLFRAATGLTPRQFRQGAIQRQK